MLEDFLAGARVDSDVSALRPDYRALLSGVDGITPAGSNEVSNSLEALLRRASTGLPQVNRLTDVYNAVSVIHQVPLGGEDLGRYVGPPRLIRATGAEAFDTVADGVGVVEHPEPGEVVWCDDAGVTCRRWSWRQGHRTQLTAETTSALSILDTFAPTPDIALIAAGDDLTDHLRRLGSDVRVSTRLIKPDSAP